MKILLEYEFCVCFIYLFWSVCFVIDKMMMRGIFIELFVIFVIISFIGFL